MSGIAKTEAMALLAGVVTSFGPCAAPRLMAIAALVGGARRWRRVALVGAFAGGLCACYVLLGLAGGAIGMLAAYSSWVYATVSAAAIVLGVRTIAKDAAENHCTGHSLASRGGCAPGAVFLAGCGFVGIASPCCGPLAAALTGAGVAAGNWPAAALMLGAFAAGHALPLVVLGNLWVRLQDLVSRRWPAGAAATVGGTLMLALGAYYGLLV
jgi:cytochrome c biogenesis protein CcdA